MGMPNVQDELKIFKAELQAIRQLLEKLVEIEETREMSTTHR